VINNKIDVFQVDPNLQLLIKGALILLAVAVYRENDVLRLSVRRLSRGGAMTTPASTRR
jgi:ribose/xylose/arabinose/galactoside ABC-type transport system permease subunit